MTGEPLTVEAGTRVRVKADPGRLGVLTGRTRPRAGSTYIQISFPDATTYMLADALEPVADAADDPLDLLAQGKLGRALDLRRNLTYIRLTGRLANVIYSMESTNTDFYPYQFKPLLSFLDSPGQGIVLADEVGLGKTIEAGLIWTELRSRFEMRRLMVLCPAMLREKWDVELRQRFGLAPEIVSAGEALARLKEYRQGTRHDFALIASMQGLRPPRDRDREAGAKGPSVELADFLEDNVYEDSLVDLLVIDEAHYLRNPATATHEIGRLLRNVSENVLLLSATPIHLGNHDLYRLLNLLDEDSFNRPDTFDLILEANAPLIRARDAVMNRLLTRAEFLELVTDAASHFLLTGNRQLAKLIEEPPSDEELARNEHRISLAHRLERMNLLAGAVTRTRKREVTEWSVVRMAESESVDLSGPEREFYVEVTELVRDWAARRHGHEGFLLVMPQRQMSSSMPAALREWQRRASPDPSTLYEDTGEMMEPDSEMGPLVSELSRRAYELGDLETLWQHDSKYRRLSALLTRYLGENPGEKVVLFAYFRPTLRYLQERLTAEGIDAVTLMGGSEIDKQEIIELFRSPEGPSVLLSSEVASEGIDLQFSRVVINYDLPWNPMKVEQRIGRIDRLGQKAPSITVWNLFYGDTIDSRIHDRLYARIGIFERALGGLEAILGDEIRKLTIDLLTGHLSPDEENRRIETAALAIENARSMEERLEDEAGALVAHGDYILNQIKAARDLERWITAQDLYLYVRDFFSTQDRYRGSEFRQVNAHELNFDVRLSSEARFDFADFLEKQRLIGQTRLAANEPKPIRCRFESRLSTRYPGVREVITQFHPLVRFVSQKLRQSEESAYPVASVTIGAAAVAQIQPGAYVFTVEQWSIAGLRDIERLAFVVAPIADPVNYLPDDAAELLVTTAARSGESWPEASGELDMSAMAAIADGFLEEGEKRYGAYITELEAENNDRADIQERSIRRHGERQRSRLREVLARHRARGRERMVALTKGRLAALEERINQRLMRIDQRRRLRHHKQEVCIGVIRVR